ncbi:metallophosphoesterase [Calothrix sp. UHCC 0171]|uniref:metallophosphoesterase family protein n=1 Tax=Calothrix sp. UHCC 0171 TaxID=3110245 RepID=UPI002B21CB96|nr:metallophosphoesterase [Calothrix sp. UHCC 0171]MEA5570280.1 metallophosphoesterase [Calothrix sp. UHCC 0171]
MKLVYEVAIAEKIRRMKQRVRWQDPLITARGIDQTRFVLDDGKDDGDEFSFLVIGDSGTGKHQGHNPQREVAKAMLPHQDECRFMLHTGDVVYLVGSSEYYQQNFLKPYREFIVNGDNYHHIAYDNMTFKFPIFPVPGNHDYYDLPLFWSLVSLGTMPIRRLLQSKLDLDVGWHGSRAGDAYAKAFLDYLKSQMMPGDLAHHLDKHYTAKSDSGYCLRYEPGKFTRLPNRYYTFRYGGIDFFALDSNTFNQPAPIPRTSEGDLHRLQLETSRQALEQQKQQIFDKVNQLNPYNPKDADQLDDSHAQITQIEEIIVDIEKQLAPKQEVAVDIEQLEWLKSQLIESWNNRQVRGRIIFFHHPPYVTEATKWQQAQTLAIRYRLREVFDAVAETIGSLNQNRPLVDLVFNGHAHCLEYLQTQDTGHADSHINWIVCGGSGFSLRRQRPEGVDLMETFTSNESRLVANSKLFLGRNGQGSQRRRPYSSIRVDVQAGDVPKFVIRPLVAEWYQRQWLHPEIEPFIVGGK